MVFHVLDALRARGIWRFLVNLHAHPDLLRRALVAYGRRHRVRFVFFYEKKLLGTGGAVRNAASFLTEPFWLVNCDFLPEGFSFAAMERTHVARRAVATLAVRWVRPSDAFNPVGVDRRGRLTRVSKVFGRGGDDRVFLGVHRLDPGAMKYLADEKIFPVFTGLYKNLFNAGIPIQTYTGHPRHSFDLGALEGYYSANFSF